MTDCKPFIWYDDDTGDTYTNEAVSDGAAPEGLRPLYDRPNPDDTALLRQALEALDIYREYDPEGGGVADKVSAALRERLGLRYEPEPNEGSEP